MTLYERIEGADDAVRSVVCSRRQQSRLSIRLLEPIVVGAVEANILELEGEVAGLPKAIASCEVLDVLVEDTRSVPIGIVVLDGVDFPV